MKNELKQTIGLNIEYSIQQREMRIYLQNIDTYFFADLDTIMIDPRIVDIRNLEIKRSGIKLDVKAPLLYNFDSDQIDNSLMFGVKFDGMDKNRFIEKIEDVARSFCPEWEQAVRKRREEIIARDNMGRKSIDE